MLTLAMIVRNEAAGIAATLETVKPWIDRWVIADTGSTDDTVAVIERTMTGIPGQIVRIPFVDFATTRNALLDAAGTDGDWLLLLDADDRLEGGEELRSFLANGTPFNAHHIWIQLGGSRHCLPRVVRSDAGCRYSGVVHEVLGSPDGSPCGPPIPDVALNHVRTEISAEASHRRWERDRDLLRAEVERSPGDTRSVFYLARTLDALGEQSAAASWYLRRSLMCGWDEERYISLLCAGRCLTPISSDWPSVQQLFLDAHALRPDRAEALCEIAQHWVSVQNWPLAYLFAQRAYDLPHPEKSILFVEDGAYSWLAADLLATAAWYLGKYPIGREAAEKAAAARPDDPRIQRNLTFYRR